MALAPGAAGMAAFTKLLEIITMTKLKAGLIGSLAVLGVGASLVFQEQRQNRLREANEFLRLQFDQLTAENDGLSDRLVSATSELEPFRGGEVGVDEAAVGSRHELRRKYLERQRLLAKAREAQEPSGGRTSRVSQTINAGPMGFCRLSDAGERARVDDVGDEKRGPWGFSEQHDARGAGGGGETFRGNDRRGDFGGVAKGKAARLPELQLDRIKTDSDTEAVYVLSNPTDTDNGLQRTHDEAVIRLKNVGGEWKSGEGL